MTYFPNKRLDNAYNNFFQQNRGFPKFKNRSTFRSFTYATGVKIKGNKIYLPKLGWVKFYNSRPIPDGFKLKSVTVRKKSNGYYVSVRIEDKAVPTYPVKKLEEVKTITGTQGGQTPTSELTENKRRKHYARKSKRDVPGNLKELTIQLSLFNQENNHPNSGATPAIRNRPPNAHQERDSL